MSQKVTIQYGDKKRKFFLERLDATRLKKVFNLEFTPTELENVDDGTVVEIVDKEHIESGVTYCIVEMKAEVSIKPSSVSRCNNKETKLIRQNALIASRATYIDSDSDCIKYLYQNILNQNFSNIIRSKSDSCPFIIAEEVDQKRIFVAFRGTSSDWQNPLKAFKLELSQEFIGKFHAGFLERAQLFPIQKILNEEIQKILNEEKYEGKDIIFCGHSMGGAVATIAAILACFEQDKHKKVVNDGNFGRIQCFTFGSPMVADGDIKKFCDEEGLSENFYHCVNFNDPVPRLLSYGMTLQAIVADNNEKVSDLENQCSTELGTDYFKGLRKSYLDQNSKIDKSLSEIKPYLDEILQTSNLILQQSASEVVTPSFEQDVLNELLAGFNSEESSPNVYEPIGNFCFISDNKTQKWIEANFDDVQTIYENMEVSVVNLEQLQESNAHCIDTYQNCLPLLPCYDGMIETPNTNTYKPRLINIINPYKPCIEDAELIREPVENEKDRLRLRLTGSNLLQMDLSKCRFNLGFPFGTNPIKTQIKKISLDQQIDIVTLEEEFTVSPEISELGLKIYFATFFGSYEYLLSKQQFRNITTIDANHLAYHDNVSKVIKMAIQRGMGITQIRRQATGINPPTVEEPEEPIISKVKTLVRMCVEEKEREKLFRIFDDNNQNIEVILSNEKEYKDINLVCQHISNHLTSLKIEAKPQILKSIGIAIAFLIGTAAIVSITGPTILLFGAAISKDTVRSAVAIGGMVAGFATNYLWNEEITDKNYSEILNFVATEMFKKFVKNQDTNNKDEQFQTISDLIADGKTYSLETVVLKMYDKENGDENFAGTLLENCQASSLKAISERIECIRVIHDIRNILSKQCYIGIVGIQDSGKTTLIRELWGIQGQSGLFTHTEVPIIHEISQRVYVVDFPGSNSLDCHAKTFSICGAMNNMIILVIPFTGDINQLISDEIAKVFNVMQGSQSTQVVLCINKCGPFLKQIKDELGPNGNADKLSERFAEKLNMSYDSNDPKIQIAKENILFTDWLLDESDQEALEFGLIGVGEIRKKIRSYLIKYNIYGENEDELEDVLTFNLKI